MFLIAAKLSGHIKYEFKNFLSVHVMEECRGSRAPFIHSFGASYTSVFNITLRPLFLPEGWMDTIVVLEDSEERKITRTYQDSIPGPSSQKRC